MELLYLLGLPTSRLLSVIKQQTNTKLPDLFTLLLFGFMFVSKFPSFNKDTSHWINQVWPCPNLIISVKTLFANKVTFTSSRWTRNGRVGVRGGNTIWPSTAAKLLHCYTGYKPSSSCDESGLRQRHQSSPACRVWAQVQPGPGLLCNVTGQGYRAQSLSILSGTPLPRILQPYF